MEQPPPRSELGPARLLALADGIFAIAMTLLVFELKVPVVNLAAGESLLSALQALWPKFGACALGFITLGFSWIGHHNQYVAIVRTNRSFLWINIGFLASIAFMPFSCALLGSYPFERTAIVTYGLNFTVAGLLLLAHWEYATSQGRLVREGTSHDLIVATRRRVALAPAAFLIGTGLCVLSPIASLVVFAAVPIYFIIPGRVDRHWGI